MCEERISYWIPEGYDYKEVKVQCGRTNPYGGVALCNPCAKDPHVQAHLAAAEDDNRIARALGLGEY